MDKYLTSNCCLNTTTSELGAAISCASSSLEAPTKDYELL